MKAWRVVGKLPEYGKSLKLFKTRQGIREVFAKAMWAFLATG
jgi:hypothetical protein